MKRAIITPLLLASAFVAENTSYSQGSLIFVNYSFGLSDYSAPVTWAGGLALGSNYTAQLLYSATGTPGTFAPVAGATSQFYATDGDTLNGAGFFQAIWVTIPSYTSGNAYFEVDIYPNIDVSVSVDWSPNPILVPAGTILGLSQPFVYSTLATFHNLHAPGDPLPDNPDVITPLMPFYIDLVPEPTTIALSSSGLLSLLAYRFRARCMSQR